MWRHFESFHIIQQPTTPGTPGQGMILAGRGHLDQAAGLWLLSLARGRSLDAGVVRLKALSAASVVFHVFIQLAWAKASGAATRP
jgi:hypothetical protein